MNIAIIRPTRGLEFAESAASIDTAKSRAPHIHFDTFRSWDLPIPECFNVLTAEALSGFYNYLWFIEEDVIVPPNAIYLLLHLDSHVAAINYYLKCGSGRLSELRAPDGSLHSLSLGCTLVRREVFERMQPPYFRVDLVPSIIREGMQPERRALAPAAPGCYGNHDAYFTFQAQQLGFSIRTLGSAVRCEHLRVTEYGVPDRNNGVHGIERVR